MQKQMILCAKVPARSTEAKYEMTAAIIEIRKVKHLICDLYCNKIKVARYAINNKDYGKYLYMENRWSKDVRYWSDIKFLGDYEHSVLRNTAVSDEAIKVFEEYGIKKDAYNTYAQLVHTEMSSIRDAAEQVKNNEKIEEQKKIFDMLPEIPNAFEKWAKGLFDSTPLSLIYKRETKYRATVGCCRCGQTVTVRTESISPDIKTISKPERGKSGKCQWCHTTGVYVPQGRYKDNKIYKNCYLFQVLPNRGLVARYFELRCKEYNTGHDIDMIERARVFLNLNEKAKTYWNHAWFGESKEFWHSYNVSGNSAYYLGDGRIYQGGDEEIEKSVLAYADYKGYAYTTTHMNHIPHTNDYIDALSAYAYVPRIEYLYKNGYEEIVRHLVVNHGVTSLINKKAKTIPDLLKIKSGRIDYLKSKNCEIGYLKVLQFEKKHNLNLQNDEIEWIRNMSSYYKFVPELKELMEYMSVRKIYNRIKEYATKECAGQNGTWVKFRDYIRIRAELGYDMSNSVYLHPRSLKDAHAEMVAERERRRNDEHIALKMKQYDRISEHYKKLKKRYGMESNGYVFVPAKTAEEIIIEGRHLHHCVGGDTYLKKHNEGETAIIFMREKKHLSAPFVTIEVKGDTIIQWYGAHDKKSQVEAVLNAIHEFEEHIKAKSRRKNKTATTEARSELLAAV